MSDYSAGGAEVVRFELTASLSVGGTAAAKVLACSGNVAVDTVITVEDTSDDHQGESGMTGVAYRWPVDDGTCNYQIIEMEEYEEWVVGKIAGTPSSGWVTAGGTDMKADCSRNSGWNGKIHSFNRDVFDRIGAGSPQWFSEITEEDDLLVCYWDRDLKEYVVLGCLPSCTWPVKTTTTITARSGTTPGSGTCQLIYGNTATGNLGTVTVKNYNAVSIASGKYGSASRSNKGEWHIHSLDCV